MFVYGQKVSDLAEPLFPFTAFPVALVSNSVRPPSAPTAKRGSRVPFSRSYSASVLTATSSSDLPADTHRGDLATWLSSERRIPTSGKPARDKFVPRGDEIFHGAAAHAAVGDPPKKSTRSARFCGVLILRDRGWNRPRRPRSRSDATVSADLETVVGAVLG